MPIVTASILGGVQSAAGIAQFLRGRSLAKQNIRAEYQIPPEIAQNLSQAQLQALESTHHPAPWQACTRQTNRKE